jgi:hypothetical protein
VNTLRKGDDDDDDDDNNNKSLIVKTVLYAPLTVRAE